MIYIIVNHTFHVEHIQQYIKNFTTDKLYFINIPYNLKENISENFQQQYTINSPYSKKNSWWKGWEFYKIQKQIKKSFTFTSLDTIVFFTEYDPITQYIVYTAKEKGARTYLFEEGLATYNLYLSPSKIKLTFKEKIKLFYFRHILSFHFLRFYKLSKGVYPILEDKYIDEVFLYYEFSNKYRDIKHNFIQPPYKKINHLNDNNTIFFNQPLYLSYMSQDEYLKLIVSVLRMKVISKIEKVYFKFHPRDDKHIKIKLKEAFKNDNIVFLDDMISFEDVLRRYKPRIVYSFFSDALMKANMMGIEIVFLYKESKTLSENDTVKNIDRFINNCTLSTNSFNLMKTVYYILKIKEFK